MVLGLHGKLNLLIFSRRNAAVPDGRFRGIKLARANIYSLKHVDYAERGQQVEIIVDGVPKRQTIIFSGTDYNWLAESNLPESFEIIYKSKSFEKR